MLNETNRGDVGDTYVKEDVTSGNYGTATTMTIKTASTNGDFRAFILLNLSTLPNNVNITNAVLKLYMIDAPTASRWILIYNTTNNWTETNLTWNNAPNENVLQDNQSSGTTGGVWLSFNITNASIAQYQQANKNISIMIRYDLEEASTARIINFATKEYTTDTTKRPQLNITYIENIPPTWSSNTSSIISNYSLTKSTFNITWNDNVLIDNSIIETNISGNSVNYTMNKIGNAYGYENIVPVGNFYWKSYANDTSGNWNTSDTWYFTIGRAAVNINMWLNGTLNNNRSTTYPQSMNATCQINISSQNTFYLYHNSTSKGTQSGTKIEYTNKSLSADFYNFTCDYPQTQNYSTFSITNYLTINKAIPFCWLTGNSTVTYETQSTIICSCNSTGTVSLYDDDVNVSSRNNTAVYWNVATHNLICNSTENANFTVGNQSGTYIVNQKNPNLRITENKTQTYPYTISQYCADDSTLLNCVLYRNDTLITSGTNYIPSVGIMNYTTNLTDSVNYTIWQNMSSITIIQNITANLSSNLTINGTEGNKNYQYPVVTNESAWYNLNNLMNNAIAFSLYVNDILIETANNIVNYFFRGLGTYTLVYNTTGNQNYTASSKAYNLTITKGIPVCTLTGNSTVTFPNTNTIICSCIGDSTQTVGLYFNNTLINDRNNTAISYPAGIVNIICNTTDGTNYTQGNQSGSLIVNRAATTVTTKFNTTTPQNYVIGGFKLGTQCTINRATELPTTRLWRGIIQMNSSTTDNYVIYNDSLGAATYNYSCIVDITQNYTATSSTNNNFVVNKISVPSINMTLNSSSGWSFDYGNQTNISCSSNLTEEVPTVNLWYQGVIKNALNNTNVTYPAGNLNFTCAISGLSNYSNTQMENTLAVAKAGRICTLATDKGWTRMYDGTASSSSCSVDLGSSDGTMTFTKNAAGVSTPDSQTNSGIFSYACQWGIGTNYSSCPQVTNTLTMGQSNTTIDIYFSKSSPQIYTIGQNLGIECIAGQSSTLQLYRNTTLINTTVVNGTRLIYNDTVGVGWWNYSCYFLAVQNYIKNNTINNNFQITQNNTMAYSWILTSPITYGTASDFQMSETVSGDGGCTYTLYRNGTIEATGSSVSDTEVLGVAVWNYTYGRDSCTNYSTTFVEKDLTITKGSPSLSLTSESWINTYPNSTTVTATETNNGDVDCTYTLFRNTTMVDNTSPYSETKLLGANSTNTQYNYTFNSSGGQNYTTGFTTRNMRIDKNTSTSLYLNLTINSTESNKTYTYGNITNATGWFNTIAFNEQTITFTLLRNGTSKGTSNPVSENNTLGNATYNYTYYTDGNDNFTASSKTYWISINKVAPIIIVSPLTTVNYLTATQTGCQRVSGDPSSVLTLIRNGTTVNSTSLPFVNETSEILGAGDWAYTCTITDTQNYTNYELRNNVTVNPASQNISLTGITNNTYPYSVTPVCEGNITANLYLNGSSTAYNNTAIQLGVATYNWTCNTTTNANYTFNSASIMQVVGIATPSIKVMPLTTVTFGTYTQTGCQKVSGDPNSEIQLLRNGTLVNSSTTLSYINESSIVLGAEGVWDYSCNIDVSQNYSAGFSSNNYLIVNPKTVTITLGNITGQTITYGGIVYPYCTASEGNCKLYRDAIDVTTMENDTVMTYSYKSTPFIFTANGTLNLVNYTYTNQSSTLTVNKASATIDLWLNKTFNNNITIPNNTVVNLTAVSNSSDNIYLYSLGVNVGVGTSPLTTEVSYSGATDAQINVSAALGSNFSQNISTNFILLDVTYPLISNIQPENNTLYGFDVPISASVSENSTVSYSINGSASSNLITNGLSNSTTETLANGFYEIVFNWNDSVNFNSTTRYFIVSGVVPSVTIHKPTSTVYTTVNVPVNVTMNQDNYTLKYSLNGGSNITVNESCGGWGNSSYQTIPNLTDSTVYSLRFFANDSLRVGTAFIVFSISVPIVPLVTPPGGGGGNVIQIIQGGNVSTFSLNPSGINGISYTLSCPQGSSCSIVGLGRSSSWTITNKKPDTLNLKIYATGNNSDWVSFLYPTSQNTSKEISLSIPSGESADILAVANVPLNTTSNSEHKLHFIFEDTDANGYNTADAVVVVQDSIVAKLWDFLMKPLRNTWHLHIPGKFSFDWDVPYRPIIAFFASLFVLPFVLKRIKILKEKRGTQSLVFLIIIGCILWL